MVMSRWYMAPLLVLLAGCGLTEAATTAFAPEPRATFDAPLVADMGCRPGDQFVISLVEGGVVGAPSPEDAATAWAKANNATGVGFGAPATGWVRTDERGREVSMEAGGVEVGVLRFESGGWAVNSARCLRQTSGPYPWPAR